VCDHDAFSGGQSVCFEDNGITEPGEGRRGLGGVPDGFEVRSRDADSLHELFGVDFASLHGSVDGRGAHDGHMGSTEAIDYAGNQWSFGADYSQIGADSFG
jgi:hypothetical protein